MIDYLFNLWREHYIPDTSFQFIMGFYGGEPLINIPLIKEIINYVEQSDTVGRQISFNMTTNAMLLDKYMDYLVEKKFNLFISLDGDEKSQSFRVDRLGNNSYEQVINNVKLLHVTHPEYFVKYVNFISVLHSRNDVEPILHFFKTQFNKTPQISMVDSSGISEDKKEDFKKVFQNIWQSLYKSPNCEVIEDEYFFEMPKGYLLSKLLYFTSGNVFLNYNQLLLSNLDNNVIYTGTCPPFSKKLFLTPNST